MNRQARREIEARLRRGGLTLEEEVELVGRKLAMAPWREFTPEERERSRDLLADVQEQYRPVRWYHGGTPDLDVGDMLLPSAETGADPRNLGRDISGRGRFVYVTPHYATAAQYAADYPGGGVVWRVEPEGEILADPVELRTFAAVGVAFRIANAFCCRRAKILHPQGDFRETRAA